MSFLPTAEEKEFQEALRDFLGREHDSGVVRALWGATAAERADVLSSVRDFGVFEWVHEGGIRALALTAREAGRSLLVAPIVSDAFWGLFVRNGVAGAPWSSDLPWSTEDVRSGAVRVCGVIGDVSAGSLVEAAPGARWLVVVNIAARTTSVYPIDELTFNQVPCLDGSVLIGELVSGLGEPALSQSILEKDAQLIRAHWLLLQSAQVLGAAERCIELFQAHGKTRRQFGVPIAGFQAVQQQAAARFAELSAASALCSFAEWCAVHDQAQVEQAALSSWHYTASIAGSLAEVMVQLHGGIGFTWEYDLHLYLRRIKALEILYRAGPEEEQAILSLSASAKGARSGDQCAGVQP